jgi:hypothetical protein
MRWARLVVGVILLGEVVLFAHGISIYARESFDVTSWGETAEGKDKVTTYRGTDARRFGGGVMATAAVLMAWTFLLLRPPDPAWTINHRIAISVAIAGIVLLCGLVYPPWDVKIDPLAAVFYGGFGLLVVCIALGLVVKKNAQIFLIFCMAGGVFAALYFNGKRALGPLGGILAAAAGVGAHVALLVYSIRRPLLPPPPRR